MAVMKAQQPPQQGGIHPSGIDEVFEKKLKNSSSSFRRDRVQEPGLRPRSFPRERDDPESALKRTKT